MDDVLDEERFLVRMQIRDRNAMCAAKYDKAILGGSARSTPSALNAAARRRLSRALDMWHELTPFRAQGIAQSIVYAFPIWHQTDVIGSTCC